MVRLYFVRHGETEYNIKHVVQGWCNSPLTELGIHQADVVGIKLSDVAFQLAFSGDLGRQKETADRILSHNKNRFVPSLNVDEGLREIHFGCFEEKPFEDYLGAVYRQAGIPYGDVAALFRKYSPAELTDLTAAQDLTGTSETAAEARKRLLEAVSRIMHHPNIQNGGNILVVSSGAALGILLPVLCPGAVFVRPIENCGVSVLEYKGAGEGWILLETNTLK